MTIEPDEAPAAEPEAPAAKPEAPAAALETKENARPAWLGELPFFLVALAASVCFGLSYGLNYGLSNQTAYMLGALRRLDPTVLNRDWYAAHTENYHPVFSYLGWLLLLFDRGGFAVGVALVVVTALGALCLYGLARVLAPGRRAALAVFLLLLAIAFVTRTVSVGWSYVFDVDLTLQPSTLGSLFLLAALPPFVSGRYLASGVLLGLSGLFHANFLVLGIATFGFAHLVMGRGGLPRRILFQIGPSLLVFLVLAPLLLRAGSSTDAARAEDILFNIRSPHHYAPKTYERDFLQPTGFQMLGFGAGAWLLRGGRGRGPRLGALVFAMAGLVWTGTLLTTAVSIPRIAQIFVFRYAPFLDLLMQLLACLAAVSLAAAPRLARRIPPSGLALVAGGFVIVAMYNGNRGHDDLARLILFIAAPALFAVALRHAGELAARVRGASTAVRRARALLSRHGASALVLYAVVVCAVTAYPHVNDWRRRSNLLHHASTPEMELYAWIRTSTPKDAVFLTPPMLERFRLLAERAIVVDWKASPILPGELVAWYQRLEAVSGRPGFRRSDELSSGYAAMDGKRLESLRVAYGVAYVVVSRGREGALGPGLTPVYENAQFAVLALDTR
jgi:hypothetical protein